MTGLSITALRDAVVDATHRLERLGYSADDMVIYLSPDTLDGLVGGGVNPYPDGVMGMPLMGTREIPDGVVVAVADRGFADRMIEFERIDNG